MGDLKKVKSIDLTSTTIIGSSINVVWSIIFALILIITFSVLIGRFNIGFTIVGLTIVFITLILSIPQYFGVSFLYNFLIEKIKIDVEMNIKEMTDITEISINSFAVIVGMISLIVAIVIYPIIYIVLSLIPLFLQILYLLSLQGFSWVVYPASFLLTPLFIIYAFVFGLVLAAVGAFVFNKITPLVGGLKVSLLEEGNLTNINSVNPKSAGIITGIICLVYGLLYGLLFGFVSGNLPANLILIVGLTIGGLIGGFIYGAICSILYNFLAKKFGPVKLELEN